MPTYEQGPGRPLMEGTEEEKQEALKVSQEAFQKSAKAYQKYLGAFDHWQDKKCPIGGESAVGNAWLEYMNVYNEYLEMHRDSAGKYGFKHKAPYPRQHA